MSAQPFQGITIISADKNNFVQTENGYTEIEYTLSVAPREEWIKAFNEDIEAWRGLHPELPLGTLRVEGDKLIVPYGKGSFVAQSFKGLHDGINQSIQVANTKFQNVLQNEANLKNLITQLLAQVGL